MNLMPNLARAITKDGSAFAVAIDAKNIVSAIEKNHKTSAVISAALGRLAISSALIGSLLKNERDSITLRVKGDGPAGSLIAVANGKGNVKAYVDHPVVEMPLNDIGKLDVKGAVGENGMLSVIKDLGLKEPYSSQIPLVSGEIAEDITNYFAKSEQIPTVCALGVLVNKNLTIKAAGGFLIQLLPFADDSVINIIEENISKLNAVSKLYDDGITSSELALKLLNGTNPKLLYEGEVKYNCDCNKLRVEKVLISLGRTELEKMIEENKPVEIQCHFCNKKYKFFKDDIKNCLTDCKQREKMLDE